MISSALFGIILLLSPVLCLLGLVIWYATHKSWTVGGVIRDIQDRIYDRQSERIYGRRSGTGLPEESPEAIEAEETEAGESEAEESEAEDEPEENASEPLPGSEDRSENAAEPISEPEDTQDHAAGHLLEPEDTSGEYIGISDS